MNQDNNINQDNNLENNSLESNIININVPEIPAEKVPTMPNPTPIEPVSANIVEKKEKSTSDNVMHEKQLDDGTVNGKGLLPVFIIFGLFIVLIIGLPYISDIITKVKSDKEIKQVTEEQKKEEENKNNNKNNSSNSSSTETKDETKDETPSPTPAVEEMPTATPSEDLTTNQNIE